MPVQYLVATPFAEWNNITVGAAIGQQITETGKQSLKFYDGDHWQMGDGWGGPRPDPITAKVSDTTMYLDKIRQVFCSSNVLAEVVDRHVSAVFGRPPSWQFVNKDPNDAKPGQTTAPTPDDAQPGDDCAADELDPLITEVEAALTRWLDKRNAHQFLLEAATNYALTGHGMIRLFVPAGLLDMSADGKNANIPSGLDIDSALDLLYIETLQPLQSGTGWHRDTMAEGAFVVWNESVQVTTGHQARTRTELQYVDRTSKGVGKTIIKNWQWTEFIGQLELDLDGQLLMHELRGMPLVTPQLLQLQRQYNFALTAMGNNNATAGFLERIITNAQPPGSYVDDPKAPGTGKKIFMPSNKWTGGPGQTVMLTGHPITDEDGKVSGYTDPKAIFRDPASPEAFRASLEEYRSAMYMEVKQGHLLAQADGAVSGTSRIHLRADFTGSLHDTQIAAEETYRWLLTTLARLVELFTNQQGRYADLRPVVQCVVNTGPLTDAERTALVDQYEKGLRSRESTMVLLGVDDPDAEFIRIRAEKMHNPVGLDTLALLGIELLPEWAASLVQRAGLQVTPEQMQQLMADDQARRQSAAVAQQANLKLLRPAGITDPGNAPKQGD